MASEEGKSDITSIELIKQDLTSMFDTPGINIKEFHTSESSPKSKSKEALKEARRQKSL